MATAAVEATTTKSTAMEAATADAASATAAHAASMSTTAAATSVTAATTATATTSECRSWLNQADCCQCEQGYNRFSHYAFPPLDERSLLGACPNSRCSSRSESDSMLGYEQVFSPLEYRSDAASATECAGLRAER